MDGHIRPARNRASLLIRELLAQMASETSSSSDEEEEPETGYNPVEHEYYMSLSKKRRLEIDKQEKKIQTARNDSIPLRFRILSSDMDYKTKGVAIRKLNQLSQMDPGQSEYCKLFSWVESLARLPVRKVKPLGINDKDPIAVTEFLKKVQATLDEEVFGHKDAKLQILMTLAKWIVNPTAPGLVLGIQGPPGVGKTTLVKDGIAKALGLPFAFVPLGGANDSSFLDGHSYTYEGSTWGRIADIMMHAGCANPVICFDELDKVQDNTRGSEIYNVLIHMTDGTQNKQFQDKYFAEVDIDISRCIIVFTFNDESKVHPVLKDRLTIIHTGDYTPKEKLAIAKQHIVPKSLKMYSMSENDVLIPDEVMESIIDKVGDSMRDVTRAVDQIFGTINVQRMLPEAITPCNLQLPCVLSKATADKIIPRGIKRARQGPPPGMYS